MWGKVEINVRVTVIVIVKTIHKAPILTLNRKPPNLIVETSAVLYFT